VFASRPARGWRAAVLMFAVCTLASGCRHSIPRSVEPTVPPLRITEIAGEGDAARRASVQLTLRGLDFDIEGRSNQAAGQYLRALQVDPNNPYAFLAVARHEADGLDPQSALPYLDKSAALMWAQGEDPRVEAHLEGLRGQALQASGEYERARPYLERAATLAPHVWSDGRLEADELR
jgi:tetratricopeptide (TPR) repeat protein